MAPTAGFMSFATFTLPSILGRKRRNSWYVFILSSPLIKPQVLRHCIYIVAVSDGPDFYRRFNFDAGFSC